MATKMRWAMVLAAVLAGCDSEEPQFPDGGNAAVDGGMAQMCGVPYGSCLMADGTCNDFGGALPPTEPRADCESHGDTWSDAPCDVADAVGGCRFELPTIGGTWCATTWWYPPLTVEDLRLGCVSPGIFVLPP